MRTRMRTSPLVTTKTGACTPSAAIEGNKVDLSYRPVILDPLTTEAEGGISEAKIAPKARTF